MYLIRVIHMINQYPSTGGIHLKGGPLRGSRLVDTSVSDAMSAALRNWTLLVHFESQALIWGRYCRPAALLFEKGVPEVCAICHCHALSYAISDKVFGSTKKLNLKNYCLNLKKLQKPTSKFRAKFYGIVCDVFNWFVYAQFLWRNLIAKWYNITALVLIRLDTKRSVRNERSNKTGSQLLVIRFLHWTPAWYIYMYFAANILCFGEKCTEK